MDTAASPSSSVDRNIEAAQAVYLDRAAPGHRTRRVRWSGGSTQMIELGEGPPVLLLHGGMGEAFQWGPILTALARTHRVLAVDRPGHGLADPHDHRGADMFALARRFIGDILDGEGLAAAPLVGSSMGGLWALAFAHAHPERAPRLVLVASPAGVVPGVPLMLRLGTVPVLRGLIRKLMRKPTRASVRDFYKQLLVVHPERLSDDYLDLSAASQARNAESWFSLIDRSVDFRGVKPDLVLDDFWEDLAVPTTFVWGEKDAFAPPSVGAALVAAHPKLRLVRIADAGHMPWYDAPEATAAAILEALA